MDITTLYRIISESSSIGLGPITARSYFPLLQGTLGSNATIKVLSGLRRCGKSFLLKLLYQDLLGAGRDSRNILFLNFEHDDLKPYLSLTGLREVFQVFLRNSDQTKAITFFFDEIQNIPDWQSFVRTQYDTGRVNIYLTGSNSRLLSSEISSKLGGRVLEFFIQPYGLDEVACSRSLEFTSPHHRAGNAGALLKLYDDYVLYGGIPESLDLTPSLKVSYRESLIEKVIVNDILPRFSLAEPDLLRKLMRYFERAAGTVRSLRNLGTSLEHAPLTIKNYLSALEQAFLVVEVQKYAFKARAILDSQPKVFHLDPLLALRADVAQKLEIAVYARLLRKYGRSYVHYARDENNHEIDFVVLDVPHTQGKAIQVCWELNAENIKRELSPLLLLQERSGDLFDTFEIIVHRTTLPTHVEIPKRIRLIKAHEFLLGIEDPQ